ncbi:MAG TPA: Rrf2 family transcriptional regulator, partial [Luteimonas sp.]|nr:Rrf2 family transcriptional regulator [Luteimonas sp.]
ARAASAITLLDVVEAIEGRLGMTECSLHAGSCGRESSCGMRANWRRINDVVADALRAVTLQHMLDGATASLPAHPEVTATPGGRAIPARLQAS